MDPVLWSKSSRAPIIRTRRNSIREFLDDIPHNHIVVFVIFFLTAAILLLVPKRNGLTLDSTPSNPLPTVSQSNTLTHHPSFNSTYPNTPVVITNGVTEFKIALVADMDIFSYDHATKLWKSHLLLGTLKKSSSMKFEVNFTQEKITLSSKYAEDNRGMELSDLIWFNGKLLTVDDRTGIVYETNISSTSVIPRHILTDGHGASPKGFKAEWMTVKDSQLVVGGTGKEWVDLDSGVVISNFPAYIKTISVEGNIQHIDWGSNYLALRKASGTLFPGYLLHEAVCWSSLLDRWVFLPRKVSSEPYNDVEDERKGSNIMIIADDKFDQISVVPVGQSEPTRGFSSFKFIPHSMDREIVALKTEEVAGQVNTYILIFNIEGDILYPETLIAQDVKYEGIEFI
eukprot:Sdes_comp9761_c0_seq1m1281